MKITNTRKDLILVAGGADGYVPFPGTGIDRTGQFRTGALELADAELPALRPDLEKFIRAGYLTVSEEDKAVLIGAGWDVTPKAKAKPKKG